jgi:glycogen operon protein
VHWDQADQPLVDFTAAVSRLRREHPTFRRRRFFTGQAERNGLDDIVWLHPDGHVMAEGDWDAGLKSLGMYLNGAGISGKDSRGGAITDDHFLLYFNADGAGEVTLPPPEYADAWDVLIDTAGSADDREPFKAGMTVPLGERSTLVLREHHEREEGTDHSVAASLAAQTGAEPA